MANYPIIDVNNLTIPVAQFSAKTLYALAKTVTGTSRADILAGASGNDVIRGGGGHDIIMDYRGNNRLYGENGNDHLTGGRGRDLLDGGAGNDDLDGHNGNDRLVGGAGNDTLAGGKGVDTLTGGRGKDVFELSVSDSIDRLTDFNSAQDSIHGIGVLGPKDFILGMTAPDANDCVLYDQGSGMLYYDPDGNGPRAPEAFAVNLRKTAMAWDDFI